MPFRKIAIIAGRGIAFVVGLNFLGRHRKKQVSLAQRSSQSGSSDPILYADSGSHDSNTHDSSPDSGGSCSDSGCDCGGGGDGGGD